MVVDDVFVNRRVAERMLTRLGYRTQAAERGLGALEVLALGEPGEPSLLEQMIDAFRPSSAAYLARMRAAFEVGDHQTVLNVAHALKGAAASLGAERVRAIASELDLALRNGQMDRVEVEERLLALEGALEQALAGLVEVAGRRRR